MGDGAGWPRPGEGYVIFSGEDVEGSLPEDYSKVLARAARWAGVREEMLAGQVVRYERRLRRIQ